MNHISRLETLRLGQEKSLSVCLSVCLSAAFPSFLTAPPVPAGQRFLRHTSALSARKVLAALLEQNMELNVQDLMLHKPIHYAACCESSGPLELILEKGG